MDTKVISYAHGNMKIPNSIQNHNFLSYIIQENHTMVSISLLTLRGLDSHGHLCQYLSPLDEELCIKILVYECILKTENLKYFDAFLQD